jgi:hypothetical protein
VSGGLRVLAACPGNQKSSDANAVTPTRSTYPLTRQVAVEKFRDRVRLNTIRQLALVYGVFSPTVDEPLDGERALR